MLAYVNSALQTGTRNLLDHTVVDYVWEKISNGEGEVEGYLNLNSWAKVAEAPFDSS
jgi:Mg2+-importing ATPase